MVRMFRLFVVVSFVLAFSFPVLAETLYGRVIEVADGDTITVLDAGNQQHKIRLAGIDAPERKQPYGSASKKHLSGLVARETVAVEWYKRDKYKRIVGKVLLDDRDICLEQIKVGMAWHYKKYQREQSPQDRASYADAEEEARTARRGLWKDAYPVPPWEWRHMRK